VALGQGQWKLKLLLIVSENSCQIWERLGNEATLYYWYFMRNTLRTSLTIRDLRPKSENLISRPAPTPKPLFWKTLHVFTYTMMWCDHIDIMSKNNIPIFFSTKILYGYVLCYAQIGCPRLNQNWLFNYT
jgi:hypothetical protein